MRDEAETSECRVEPRSDLDPQQLSLTSLKNLQLDVRALVIILKAKAMLIRSHQVMFERGFQNSNEGQVVSRLSNEVNHHLWLQGPLRHLGGEWQASYIIIVICQILEFLNI